MDSTLSARSVNCVAILLSLCASASVSALGGEGQSWTPDGLIRTDDGEYVNEADGSILVLVPAPEIPYITHDSRRPWYQIPRRRVDYPFMLGKYEVSRSQYRLFCSAKGRSPSVAVTPPDLPVVGLEWEEMEAYCKWAAVRLPTLAEWEYAAIGSRRRTFPWGEEMPSGTRINSLDQSSGAALVDPWDDGFPTLAPVRALQSGASWIGAVQMLGNASEAVFGYEPSDEGDQRADRLVYGGSAWDRASPQHWMWTQLRFEVSDKVGFRICRRYADGPF